MKLVRKASTISLLGFGFWLLIVAIGSSLVVRYANTAGAVGTPPAEWPGESSITRTPGKPILLVMIHPQCPCSRASINELARLMVSVQGRVSAKVVFIRPQGQAEDWVKTDLWASAAIIPGVDVSIDDEGVEANRFASKTSGQVMLYGGNGRLMFSGGITAARGHSGDNAGSSAIVALLTTNDSGIDHTSIFGCPLLQRDSEASSADSCTANHGK